MSSSGFDATLDLAPRASMRAFGSIFALHVGLLALLPFAMQPGPPLLILLCLFAGSWLWLRRHPAIGLGERALTRLTWHAEGHWTVTDGRGRRSEAELLGHSLLSSFLIVLNFRLADGTRRTRVLFGDELPPEQQRRLRVRLGALRGT